MGIDFGEKSVGLAVTDEAQTMVFGCGLIKNYGSLLKLARKLANICSKERVVKIVMGVPVSSVVGKSQQQAKRMRRIGVKLQKCLERMVGELPLEFEDESFSSFEAEKVLKQFGVKPIDYKRSEDEMAAIIILQNHLK